MKRPGILIAAFLACFLLAGLCAAGQPQGLTLKDLQEQADDFARDGAYKEAIDYYKAALKKTNSDKGKGRIGKKMRQAGKRWYIQIGGQIEQIRSDLPQGYGERYPATILPYVDAPPSRTAPLEKIIQLCQLAKSLDIVDQKGKDLERARKTVGGEWRTILVSLWQAAAEYDQGRNQLDLSAQTYRYLNQLDKEFFHNQGPIAEYNRLAGRISSGKRLADEAGSLIDAKQHRQAASKLNEAERIYPNNPKIQQIRARIEAEQRQYGILKSEGEAAQATDDLKLALSKLEGARQVHPEFAARDSLAAEINRLRDQIARAGTVVEEESTDTTSTSPADSSPGSGTVEDADPQGLPASGDPEPTHESDPPIIQALLSGLQEGLSALVGGDPQRAIQVLEGISEAATGEMEVHLQAYLGAAYSAAHLSSPEGAERDQWLEKARASFRRMLALRSEHQLSSRLFSPAIRDILERIRTEGTNPSG